MARARIFFLCALLLLSSTICTALALSSSPSPSSASASRAPSRAVPLREHVEYVGAIAEIWPAEVNISAVAPEQREPTALSVMERNVALIERCVAQAPDAHIIVFPEDGLYNFDYFDTRDSILPFLQQVHVGDVPCDYAPDAMPSSRSSNELAIISRLSCLARKYEKVLVLDVGEVEWCDGEAAEVAGEECPSDGRFQYNTQVAISESGGILQKYRKTHLFPEDFAVFNANTLANSFAYFDTSFGVRFGMFICFDMFFRVPSLALARAQALGIQDFVFSTYWENSGTFPLITANQIQQGWSRAAASNLLASNIGYGGLDSGSGIYSAGDPLRVVWNEVYNTTDNVVVTAPLQSLRAPPDTVLPLGGRRERWQRSTATTTGTTKEAAAETSSAMGRGRVWGRVRSPRKRAPTATAGPSLTSAPHAPNPYEMNATSVPATASLHFFNSTGSGFVDGAVSLLNGPLSCDISWRIEGSAVGGNTEWYVAYAYAGPYFEGLLNASVCGVAKCAARDTCLHVLGFNADTQFAQFAVRSNIVQPAVFLNGDGGVLYPPTAVAVSTVDAPQPSPTAAGLSSAPASVVRSSNFGGTVLSFVAYSEIWYR